ncbi:hypothetical protein FRB97_009081 [Tulasnella sp. 331]|nr:hypothetical protein FRB97_009081 [Tulasnella sp. 331]
MTDDSLVADDAGLSASLSFVSGASLPKQFGKLYEAVTRRHQTASGSGSSHAATPPPAPYPTTSPRAQDPSCSSPSGSYSQDGTWQQQQLPQQQRTPPTDHPSPVNGAASYNSVPQRSAHSDSSIGGGGAYVFPQPPRPGSNASNPVHDGRIGEQNGNPAGGGMHSRRSGSQTYSPSPASAGGTPAPNHPTPPADVSSPPMNLNYLRQRAPSNTSRSTSSSASSPAPTAATPPSIPAALGMTPSVVSASPLNHQQQQQYQYQAPGPHRLTRQPSHGRLRPSPNPEMSMGQVFSHAPAYPLPGHPYQRPPNHQATAGQQRTPRRNTTDPNALSSITPEEMQRRMSQGAVHIGPPISGRGGGTKRGRGMSVSNGHSGGETSPVDASAQAMMMSMNPSVSTFIQQQQQPPSSFPIDPQLTTQQQAASPYHLQQMRQLNLHFNGLAAGSTSGSSESSLSSWNSLENQQQMMTQGMNNSNINGPANVSPLDVVAYNGTDSVAGQPGPGRAWWPSSLDTLTEQQAWMNTESPTSATGMGMGGAYELGVGGQGGRQGGFNVGSPQELFNGEPRCIFTTTHVSFLDVDTMIPGLSRFEVPLQQQYASNAQGVNVGLTRAPQAFLLHDGSTNQRPNGMTQAGAGAVPMSPENQGLLIVPAHPSGSPRT